MGSRRGGGDERPDTSGRGDDAGLSVRPEAGGRDVLIVAGEASGDLHGAGLASELQRLDPRIRCFGVGGDRMAAAGVELLYHVRSLAVVGITEVVSHLWEVHRAMRALERAARRRRVDAVVLIDYPDFNLRLARRLRRARPDAPIVYYISPQVWAWRSGRVRTIAELVDKMLVILPFETGLYDDAGVDVEFVGHPLLDVVGVDRSRQELAAAYGVPEDATWVALAPGSRTAEVERLLPPLLAAAARLLEADDRRRFLVPRAPDVDAELYARCLAGAPDGVSDRTAVIEDATYAAIGHSAAAAVCSGTATLETALLGTPMVVVYRTSWLTYNLAKSLVRIPDIALVNVVAGRRGVPELVQGQVTGPRIAAELEALLEDGEARRRVQDVLSEVRQRLGEPGASGRAARAVLDVLDAGGSQRPSR